MLTQNGNGYRGSTGSMAVSAIDSATTGFSLIGSASPSTSIGAPGSASFSEKSPKNFYKGIRKSAGNIIVKVEKQWYSARLPVCRRENAVEKLIGLHFKWKSLHRNKSKKNSPAQMKNQSLFQTKLAELFDITDQKKTSINKLR
ncbi:uncharacterized protein LOC141525895 isoform X1 [Cotesia typhae]|uniref:uncharacterized protein LOC141525895 isoform X1 n=1 Tax=Cotesia typhae TaxID=2053667 RepID=UPI003D68D63E